jgi:hypothetical protein
VIEAAAARWRKYGMDRLYVTARDGDKLGWHDLQTGETHYVEPMHHALMDATIAQWRAANGFGAPTSGAAHEPPTSRSEGRHRAERDLAEQLPGTGPLERVWELDERKEALESRDQALRDQDRLLRERDSALREQDRLLRNQAPMTTFRWWLRGERSPEREQIAEDRDQVLRERAELSEHAARTRMEKWAIDAEARPWQVGARGEETVAHTLNAALRSKDPRWRVIHSIPLGEGRGDIDHLVVGPSGVYTLNTKHHPGKRLFVYYEAMTVNGTRVDYIRKARWEAQRAARTLSGACHFRISVTGLVVPVKMQEIALKAQPRDVVVVPGYSLVEWLASGPDKLDEDTIAAIYEVARHGRTWLS